MWDCLYKIHEAEQKRNENIIHRCVNMDEVKIIEIMGIKETESAAEREESKCRI